jgi:hypothetical protein
MTLWKARRPRPAKFDGSAWLQASLRVAEQKRGKLATRDEIALLEAGQLTRN